MGSQETDAELLDRAKAGDGAAFGLIFQRHGTAVYNFCVRRLGSWSAAEDAASLVFLEAWRRRDAAVEAGNGDGLLLPWLLGVANNVTRNVGRAVRRHDAALFRLPPPGVVPDHADEVAGRLDDRRRLELLRERLGRLRRGEREAVELVLLAGLSYADAAVALGIPIGTVRSRLSRARERLNEERPRPISAPALRRQP